MSTQITTILPTFRRPSLLRRAMLSVLEQDHPSLRLSVFDNASGDETAEVVAALAKKDKRIRYHCHERNIGGPANFDYGLHQVDTPFFSILSDDDYLLPGFYRHAVADLEQHPQAMFWAGLTLNVDESRRIWDARVARWAREGLFAPPEGALQMSGGRSPTWTGILFRREVLEVVGFPDAEMLGPADLDFVVRIAARFPILVRKRPSAVFTLNEASFSSTQPLSSFWPGWQKMLGNFAAYSALYGAAGDELLSRFHADARRMLFRRGANALAQGRYDFAREAAEALAHRYRQHARAGLLRAIASVCEASTVASRAYVFAYRLAERKLVASRAGLQSSYGGLIRRE